MTVMITVSEVVYIVVVCLLANKFLLTVYMREPWLSGNTLAW